MTAQLTNDVPRAARILRAGGIVAFATETVYGLGANALDPLAVAKVFAAKERPFFDPLIVHLADAEDVDSVAAEVPPLARRLIARFWPGPLTLVLPRRKMIPDLVTAGLETVAVRVPDHPLARELIRLSGVPVAAPSANPFGGVSPTTAAHVLESLGDRIDLILDGGPCRVGVESTVLQLRPDAPPLILRPGGVTLEQLEAEIGPVELASNDAPPGTQPQAAPGLLEKHYAPQKQLILVEDWAEAPQGEAVGVLAFSRAPERQGTIEVLSPSGSLNEAAAGFFSALRRLDAAPIDVIVAMPFPDQGLGRALNDRLRRAAAK